MLALWSLYRNHRAHCCILQLFESDFTAEKYKTNGQLFKSKKSKPCDSKFVCSSPMNDH